MREQPLLDADLKRHLEGIAGDGMDIYLLTGGTVRLVVVHGTTLVNRMRVNHNLNPTAALVLGQAYLLALLAASTLKDNEKLSLIVDADGPVRGLAAEANSLGQVRGYLRDSEVSLRDTGSVEALFGRGSLGVMRVGPDNRPFHGQIEWPGGDLVQNMARYYAESEQTETLLDVNVHFDSDRRITGAAGMLVQALPGARAGVVEAVGEAFQNVRPLGATFAAGATAASLVQSHVEPWRPDLVATRPAEFYCSCSKERFGAFLGALPQSEQDDILAEGPFPLKTTCHNCNSTYEFSRDELAALFSGAA